MRLPHSSALLAAALSFLGPPPESEAQADPIRLHVNFSDGAAEVEFSPSFGEEILAGPLNSGLPVRLRLVTELWRDRFVDALEGRSEWRATVVLDPLGNRYRVEVAPGGGAAASQVVAADLSEVRQVLAEGHSVSLAPTGGGVYYYMARLEVETLSASDLEDLSRWLRGEMGPAVEGGGGVTDAVGRGLRRLLVRILGLPVERFEIRSQRFEYPGERSQAPGTGS